MLIQSTCAEHLSNLKTEKKRRDRNTITVFIVLTVLSWYGLRIGNPLDTRVITENLTAYCELKEKTQKKSISARIKTEKHYKEKVNLRLVL